MSSYIIVTLCAVRTCYIYHGFKVRGGNPQEVISKEAAEVLTLQ